MADTSDQSRRGSNPQRTASQGSIKVLEDTRPFPFRQSSNIEWSRESTLDSPDLLALSDQLASKKNTQQAPTITKAMSGQRNEPGVLEPQAENVSTTHTTARTPGTDTNLADLLAIAMKSVTIKTKETMVISKKVDGRGMTDFLSFNPNRGR